MSTIRADLVLNIATLGPIGRIPIAPGTWGSGVAVVIWYLTFAGSGFITKLSAILIITFIAIFTATKAEDELGHDASPIVIDELCGQWITLLFITPRWVDLIVGFFLFRLFDIWKPFPVYQIQKLPKGLGVVADDILAGIYAGLVLLLFVRLTNG